MKNLFNQLAADEAFRFMKFNKNYALLRNGMIVASITGAFIFAIAFFYCWPTIITAYFPRIEERERIPTALFSGGVFFMFFSWWPLYLVNSRKVPFEKRKFPWFPFLLSHGMFVGGVLLLLIEAASE